MATRFWELFDAHWLKVMIVLQACSVTLLILDKVT